MTNSSHSFPWQSAHLCGIGGAGMSGLARILLELGLKVSGSDRTPSAITERLIEMGADIRYDERPENLSPETGVLIHSAAIRPEHPEWRRASELKIPRRKYAEVLGELTKARNTIAVAGTHGKTTTTMILATLLHAAGRDSGWVVGGVPSSLPAPAKWGRGEEFVVEACEYDHSFLQLHPKVVLLNNIEPDHMDYFGSLENVIQAFTDLVNKLPSDGLLVVNADNYAASEVATKARCRVVTYSVNNLAHYSAHEVRYQGANTLFRLDIAGRPLTDLQVSLPGQANLENTLAAVATACELGVSISEIIAALHGPVGVARRFEQVTEIATVPVIDDYAHHPTAVKHLMESARRAYPGQYLRVVFQAHQYARLLNFFEAFAQGLRIADEVIICPTYAAREGGVVRGEPEANLMARLRELGTNAVSVDCFADAIDELKKSWAPGQVVFTVGAGDVTEIAHSLKSMRAIIATSLRRSGRFDPRQSDSEGGLAA